MENLTKGDSAGSKTAFELPPPETKTIAGDPLPLLEQAARVVERLGEDFASELGRLAGLKSRLEKGRFHLAVLGQFKRGKSTLLNALLGEAVLPTAVIPVTAIPTFVRSGQTYRARVHFQDQRKPEEVLADSAEKMAEHLAGYVAEARNPGNRLGVRQVDVFLPGWILDQGVVLIDTPGVGSTFRHNTETALNFLPQCDAALFLVSADPPITEVEIEFLRQVRAKVPRLFFILNKVDYLDEKERRAALEFLRQVLTEQAGLSIETPVFCVSAKQALDARRKNDMTAWHASGLEELEQRLIEFFASEKTPALRQAVSRKTKDLLSECVMRLRLAVRSLQIPMDELRTRQDIFERKIKEAQRERVQTADLLAGEHRRIRALLEKHAENLRLKAREYLEGIALETMAKGDHFSEREVQDALAEAIPGFFEHHSGETTSFFRRAVSQALSPHQKRADDLIESVRQTAAELFDVPYHAPESADAFEIVQDPYWVTHQWTSHLIPAASGLLDRLMPASARAGRLRRRLLEQASALVIPNVENLRWAIFQSINQAFAAFGSALDQRLANTIAATHGAIHAALERRRQHGETVKDEVARLEAASKELERIRTLLVGS